MENRDLKNLAYKTLRKKLINCEYKPGSMLKESQLCEDLGISRTPIREALTRIAHEGFIRVLPKKGILVTDISLNDVMQIFQVRLEVEPVTIRMAVPSIPEKALLEFRKMFSGDEPEVRVAYKLDTAMHMFIIEYCGNRFLIEMMRKVFDENTRVIISSKQNQCKIHDARLEHLEILDLLLERKVEKASEAMADHVTSCKKAALDYFYNMSPSPIPLEDSYKIEIPK